MSDYISARLHRLDGWKMIEQSLTSPDGCKALWYASSEASLFEGQHAANLLLVIDEAKSVEPSIFLAAERLQATTTLYCSSPGAALGSFYDCFAAKRQHYRTRTVTAKESSHVKPEWIQSMADLYGLEHPLYRSAVLAEFTEAVEGALISLEAVNRCIDKPPLYSGGPIVAGIDLAASSGGDESVLCVRHGNRIVEMVCWRDSDAMRVAGRCLVEMERLKVPRTNVFADAGGVGAGIVARMREMGWPINAVQFGGRALDPNDPYSGQNRMTELWATMAKQIEDQRVILPRDDVLIAELVSRKTIPQSNGKLKLESKVEMKKRGLRSPDRAEALALCLQSPESGQPVRTTADAKDDDDEFFNGDHHGTSYAELDVNYG